MKAQIPKIKEKEKIKVSSNGKWRKLKVDNTGIIKEKFVNCQTKIRVGALACDADQVMNTILIPLITGKKRKGQAWLYEQQEPELTMIFGVKYIEHMDKWMIMATMSYPFTADNFAETCSIMGQKIVDFMQQKRITEILGSWLLIYDYDNSIYATAGFSKQQFLDFIKIEYGKKGIDFRYNEEAKWFELRLVGK